MRTIGTGGPQGGFKSFVELRRYVAESAEGLELVVYPFLVFGAFFWIPDEESGFGHGGRHPWVVVTEYQRGAPTVIACPRTSQYVRGTSGLFVPRGVITGLDRDGTVLLKRRRPFPFSNFKAYEYIDVLPEEWLKKLRDEIDLWAKKIAVDCEEP